MKNRLQFFKRSMFLIAFCWLAFANNGLAQPFTFDYTGVDSFFVDATTCTSVLDWGDPASVTAVCNTPGCAVVSFDLTSIMVISGPAGSYSIGDQVPGGTRLLITYFAQDNLNNIRTFGFQLDFVDTTPPVFDPASLPPAAIAYDCFADGIAYAVTATDNCSAGAGGGGGGVTITETSTGVPSDCAGGTFSRIWTATDAFGNSSSFVQSVTINPDNTAPVISGPFVEGGTFFYECDNASSNAATYDIWFNQQLANFTASIQDTNGCGGGAGGGSGITIAPQTAPVFNSLACGTTTVTFSATDACGNASFGTANFEVMDTTPLDITDATGQNIIVQCNLLLDTPIQQIQDYAQNNFTVVGACGTVVWTNNFNGLANGCGGDTGQASVTYTATDGCGNSDAVNINFNVLDSNPPNITNGALDVTIECDGAGNVADLTDWINTRAGAIAVDVCTPQASIIEGLVVTSDPNTNDPFLALQNAFSAGCTGNSPATITVEFTYTDLCNNTSTTDADFVIRDTSVPFINFPAAIATVNCADQASLEAQLTTWINTAGGATGTDPCSSNLSFRADPPLAGALTAFQASQTACGRTGSISVDFYLSDACGTENPVPTTASFNVVDVTDPVWTAGPSDITVECDGTNDPGGLITTWLGNFGGGAAMDDCSNITITNNYAGVTNTCGAAGSVLVTFTATDACGNSTVAIATVNIVDTTNPTWTVAPTDLTIACDGSADPGGAIQNWLDTNGAVGLAVDACSVVTYSHNFTGVSSDCGASGSTAVVFTATDACGNSANISASLTIVDNDPPTLTGPAFGAVEQCDGTGNTAALNAWLANNGGATATDNCGMVVWSNDFTGLSDLCGATGAATVIFTATDPCGLTVTSTATFTIADTTVPTIFDLAEDITVECNNLTTEREDWINLHGNSTATDNCSLIDNSAINSGTSNWTFTSQGFVPGCGNSGSETIVFQVTDACGLSNTTSATITITDNISPEINPTSTDFFEQCGGGDDQAALEAWINNTGGAMATDGCGNHTWTQIEWRDDDGTVGTGNPFTGPYPTVTGSDCTFVVEVTFTVVDECMNTSTTESSFWVIDQENPVMTGVPANQTVECSNIPAPTMPTATDNCDSAVEITMTETMAPGACADAFTLTRTWVATDDCGNTAADFQIITVEDTTPPTLSGIPGPVTIECNSIPFPPVIGFDIFGADNCDTDVAITFAETSTQGANPASCAFHNYTITRTWTGVDNCSNSFSASQVITVQDTTAPTFTTPTDVTVECENANNIGFTGDLVFFDDNCDPSPVIGFTDVIVGGNCPDSFTINRTWTATDVCGNVGTSQQVITVQDTTAPAFSATAQDMSLECGAGVDADAAFASWLANNASAAAADNCGTVGWFSALAGTYDPTNPATWPQSGSGSISLGLASCPSAAPGVYRSETVDFVAFDDCGNAAVSVATFSVTDNTPPVFQSCPTDVTVTNTPGNCDATFTLPAPVIVEDCGSSSGSLSFTDTEPITSPVPGDDNTIVNPVTLDFGVIPAAPAAATSPVSVTIDLINVDAEEPTEYFVITGEDGSVLGQTQNTGMQCGNSQTVITIPASLFNVWAADGTLSLVFTPNVPAGLAPIFGINDICPQGPPTGGGSSIVGNLNYISSAPTAIDYQYSVNGGANVPVNPVGPATEVLPVGTNTITYFATDCAGNTSTCAYTVLVEDTVPPSITCPADITLTVGPDDNCTAGVSTTLPLPTGLSDACGFNESYSQIQPISGNGEPLTFSYNPNYLDYVADDTEFNFLNTAANAAGNVVTFSVTLIGDVESTEEFFTLIGENGTTLGTTEIGQPNVVLTPGNCAAGTHGMSVTTITVPVGVYNTWAADGVVTIDAISNNTFVSPPPGVVGDGINPSCTTFPNGTANGLTDGVSSISMDLNYTIITPSYSVTGATTVPLTQLLAPSIAPVQSFAGGVSTVCYQVTDDGGNVAECCFDVTVVDNTPPTAICQPATVFVNPSGFGTVPFDPSTIDGGSFDNCEITSITSSPSVIDCAQAGTTVNVILTITDSSGNSSTCSTPVLVATEKPTPEFGLGICGDADLQLFANPPAGNGATFYSYQWSGPNGFMSTQADPVIASQLATGGFYTVTITGVTGCQAVETISVVIPPNTNTPAMAISDNTICTNGSATLSTQFYPGNNVTYFWFTGFAPNGTQIGATASQNFLIQNATPGVFNYYVVVDVDGCVSNPSNNQALTVDMGVIAATNDTALNVCEGESVFLGTNTTCSTCTYQWTGPNGFNSTAQFPPAFNSVNASAGTYTLTIFSNGCPSAPVTTELNVASVTQGPQIAVSGLGCEGGSITLTANNPNAATYTWTAPNAAVTTTTVNSLTINNVTTADVGNWTVSTSQNGCNSTVSAPVMVTVEPAFAVTASNAGPACDGGTVQLTTTAVAGGSYQWTGPNGYISFTQTPTAPAVSGTYSVQVTSAAGCVSNSSTVVSTQQAPDVTAISNNGSACSNGATVNLVPTIFPVDQGQYTYTWTGPNGFTSSSPTPGILNATSAANGVYFLTVSNGAGCSSTSVSTTVAITDSPTTPEISLQNALCEGDNLSLTTNSYAGSNVVYSWNTPQGVVTTVTPVLNIANVATANSGNYTVSVAVDGCSSVPSEVMPISIFSVPTAPTANIDGNCSGEDLQLSTTAIAGATYLWTGPNGFTSTISNPMIMNASSSDEGNYSVQVVIGSCVSPVSDPVFVAVDTSPEVPMATNSGSVCLGDMNASAVLEVVAGTTTPGGLYTWHEVASNAVVGTPTNNTMLTIPDLSGFPPGTYEFYVVASLGGCTSEPSVPTSITIADLPTSEAFAGADMNFCGTGITNLNGTAPASGTGMWTQTSGSGAVITDPSDPNTSISGLMEGVTYTFAWSLSNGPCVNYDMDEVTITVQPATDVAVAPGFQACDATTAVLNATAPITGVSGMWTQPAAQAALGVVINNPSDPNSNVTGLEPNNNYTFTWTLSNAACGDFSFAESIVEVLETNTAINAGADQVICDGDGTDAVLEASINGSGNGVWTSMNSNVSISTPNQESTVVFDLQPGANVFLYSVDNGLCGMAEDEVVIFIESGASAADDTFTVPVNSAAGSSTLNVSSNDVTPASFTTTITQQPSNGTATVNSDGTINYSPNAGYVGQDAFEYEVCSEDCTGTAGCTRATVTITVGEDVECSPPSIITPNGDGINDAFKVNCLASSAFENNVVIIFNQWGDEVYRKQRYTNDWEGTYDGDDLPASTYFYVVDLGDGSEPMTGFLVIER